MTKKDIDKAIRDGEIIVTTKEIVKEAVMQSISCLYDDVSDFANNRYKTGRDREFAPISEQQQNDIANEVLDYLYYRFL